MPVILINFHFELLFSKCLLKFLPIIYKFIPDSCLCMCILLIAVYVYSRIFELASRSCVKTKFQNKTDFSQENKTPKKKKNRITRKIPLIIFNLLSSASLKLQLALFQSHVTAMLIKWEKRRISFCVYIFDLMFTILYFHEFCFFFSWWKLIWFLLTLLTRKANSRTHVSYFIFLSFCSSLNDRQRTHYHHQLRGNTKAARRIQNFYSWIKINCISRRWTLASVTLLIIPIKHKVKLNRERALKKVNSYFFFLFNFGGFFIFAKKKNVNIYSIYICIIIVCFFCDSTFIFGDHPTTINCVK